MDHDASIAEIRQELLKIYTVFPDLRQCFNTLRKKYHPDFKGADADTEKYKALEAAHEKLKEDIEGGKDVSGEVQQDNNGAGLSPCHLVPWQNASRRIRESKCCFRFAS